MSRRRREVVNFQEAKESLSGGVVGWLDRTIILEIPPCRPRRRINLAHRETVDGKALFRFVSFVRLYSFESFEDTSKVSIPSLQSESIQD